MSAQLLQVFLYQAQREGMYIPLTLQASHYWPPPTAGKTLTVSPSFSTVSIWFSR